MPATPVSDGSPKWSRPRSDVLKTIDEALTALGEADPNFWGEIRQRLAPVRDRFFAPLSSAYSDHLKDGLHTAPFWLTEPDLRKVAVELAEFAMARGIDINAPWDSDGRTLLHDHVLLRDPAIAVEAVTWFLGHGADPNQPAADGETPFRLALRYGRVEVAEVMRAYGGHE
jgi:ankyrin repeat protein